MFLAGIVRESDKIHTHFATKNMNFVMSNSHGYVTYMKVGHFFCNLSIKYGKLSFGALFL